MASEYIPRSNPGKLENINYSIPKVEDKWSEDYFYEIIRKSQELAKIDTTSKGGLDSLYKIITDPNFKQWDSQTTQKAHKSLTSIVSEGIAMNSLKNIKDISNTLNNEQALQYGLTFGTYYDSSSSEKYVSVAKSIEKAQTIALDIKNNPKAYLEKRLEGLSGFSRVFWEGLSREILDADQKTSQRNALNSLNEYGSAQNYLAENILTSRRLADDFSKKDNEFQEKISKAYGERVRERGGYLTASEEAEFMGGFDKEREELINKNILGAKASKEHSKMLGEIIGVAYQNIDERKKKETEENKAKGSKDKK